MFSKKFQNHLLCDCCGSNFPEMWVLNRTAYRIGKHAWCSSFCYEQYEEGTHSALPFAFERHKPSTTNGHTLKGRVQ